MDEKKFNKKNWIMASLRRMSYRYLPRNLAQKNARKDRGLYECASCKSLFKAKEFAIDHIEPVIPLQEGFPMHPITGGPDWTIVIDRLFCDVKGFQILCIPCHDIKTQIEDSMRASYNAKRKEEEKAKIKLDKKAKKV